MSFLKHKLDIEIFGVFILKCSLLSVYTAIKLDVRNILTKSQQRQI